MHFAAKGERASSVTRAVKIGNERAQPQEGNVPKHFYFDLRGSKVNVAERFDYVEVTLRSTPTRVR